MCNYWVLTSIGRWMKYKTALKKNLKWSEMVMERPNRRKRN